MTTFGRSNSDAAKGYGNKGNYGSDLSTTQESDVFFPKTISTPVLPKDLCEMSRDGFTNTWSFFDEWFWDDDSQWPAHFWAVESAIESTRLFDIRKSHILHPWEVVKPWIFWIGLSSIAVAMGLVILRMEEMLHHQKDGWNPINSGIKSSTVSTGAGFLPSTVCWCLGCL